MNDTTIAENIRRHIESIASAEKFKRDLAVNLIIECHGRKWEIEQVLHKAYAEYQTLVGRDNNV